jgi:hypothetical protein
MRHGRDTWEEMGRPGMGKLAVEAAARQARFKTHMANLFPADKKIKYSKHNYWPAFNLIQADDHIWKLFMKVCYIIATSALVLSLCHTCGLIASK